MAQCYKPQELEEINRSVLISMANAQRSIVAMLIKFKPGKKRGKQTKVTTVIPILHLQRPSLGLLKE